MIFCNITGQDNLSEDFWNIKVGNPNLIFNLPTPFDKLKDKQFKDKLREIIFTVRPDIMESYINFKSKKK